MPDLEERINYNDLLGHRSIDALCQELLREGLVDESRLQAARAVQDSTHEGLGEILLRLGYVSEEELIRFLGRYLRIPYINLMDYAIAPEAIKLVPLSVARQYKLIPLFFVENELSVAMADPLDSEAVDQLVRHTHMNIKPVLSGPEEIMAVISRYYDEQEEEKEGTKEKRGISPAREGASPDITFLQESAEKQGQNMEDLSKMAPVVRLVNEIILDGLRRRGSDIHLEPEEKRMLVRYRIDGVLQVIREVPVQMSLPVISRIKILAGLDIAEKRLPQDGSVSAVIEANRHVDLRISTFPTVHGEKVVIRILDQDKLILTLEDLGFLPNILLDFETLVDTPYGIILVTGPTGSGKTTTLYAALSKIKDTKKNIVTLEDPIEYVLPGIRQTQINPKIGLTFAHGLRSILRQDPDIIMLGEIRDLITAEIAMQSSLTGHLVFSTLHTNNAPSALTRLADIGVPPYLVSNGIIGVLAQRLVRQICPACKEPYKAGPKELALLKWSGSEDLPLYRGKGCPRCHDTGYYDRIGLFELMVMSEPVRELSAKRFSTAQINRAARKLGMRSLREDGFSKVIKGITTLEEVLRVTCENY